MGNREFMPILVLVIWLAVGSSGGRTVGLTGAAGVVASLEGVMAVMAGEPIAAEAVDSQPGWRARQPSPWSHSVASRR